MVDFDALRFDRKNPTAGTSIGLMIPLQNMNQEHSQSALQLVELLTAQRLDLLRNVLAIDLRPLPFTQQASLLKRPGIEIGVVVRGRRLIRGGGRANNVFSCATCHVSLLYSYRKIAQLVGNYPPLAAIAFSRSAVSVVVGVIASGSIFTWRIAGLPELTASVNAGAKSAVFSTTAP